MESRPNPSYKSPTERESEMLGAMVRDINAVLVARHADAPLSLIASAAAQLVFVNLGAAATTAEQYDDAVRKIIVSMEINAESTKHVLIEKGVLECDT